MLKTVNVDTHVLILSEEYIWYAILLPHDTCCDKYYICTNGVAVENNCPPGLNFNPAINACDLPSFFPCSSPKVPCIPPP
ncbi:hypothetical protein RN001_007176 [Aquatica leii]|uniref:Chitin-binding type-2 domain-containing protein n=1 Tax=Aquatica leii TaxID=1421715 RepID=A0AAN7SQT9_9COLE|nr:hypothetical protein RN001_007176 [Aquatica leii]